MEHLDNLYAHLDRAEREVTEPPAAVEAIANLRRLVTDLPTERKGTAKEWFSGRTMTEVDTVQVRRNGMPWVPGPRMVESFATMVRLDGSVRMFSGLHVIAADDDTLVVHDTSGFDTVIVYRAVPR